MTIIVVDKLRFREKDGILEASSGHSDDDADWAEVATIPVEDHKELKDAFPEPIKRYMLATVAGFLPPSGEIYILVPPECKAVLVSHEVKGQDVREVTPTVQGSARASYRIQHFAVVKEP